MSDLPHLYVTSSPELLTRQGKRSGSHFIVSPEAFHRRERSLDDPHNELSITADDDSEYPQSEEDGNSSSQTAFSDSEATNKILYREESLVEISLT